MHKYSGETLFNDMKKQPQKTLTRKIIFVTGTRADFGKMKSLIATLSREKGFTVYIFVTGMHLSKRYGETVEEIVKDGFSNIHRYSNGSHKCDAAYSLASTIVGFKEYVNKIRPDLIIVHGDRIETLAGAIVGALTNIRVGHIEGGEVSGTIDEHIRHATSKFAHIHFVARERARRRLIQLGEQPESIFIIGSPDLDIMLSENLPSIEEVRTRYQIPFEEYGIVAYHPVTTEIEGLAQHSAQFADALIESGQNYVVIYPNNDLGGDVVLDTFKEKFSGNQHFKVFPSMRFEYFLTLIKSARVMVGNSSAGLREAPFYGTPSIDVGTRQGGRLEGKKTPSVIHVGNDAKQIKEALQKVFRATRRFKTQRHFGKGDSKSRFLETVKNGKLWDVKIQKRFIDLE